MSDFTGLDLATIEKLKQLGGGPFAGQMIDLFFQYLPGKLAEAKAGLGGGDFHAIQQAVHPIKSSANNVGAVAVRELARQIEQLALDKNGETIPALLHDLEEAYARVAVQLKEQRAGLEA
ncbi:MAG: hypothetical protein PCFJNLEI_01321 [Verrucomicrobiae bacterium]|nr:hypothetical protein [Verrucomicrobiae bacterium]